MKTDLCFAGHIAPEKIEIVLILMALADVCDFVNPRMSTNVFHAWYTASFEH